MSAKATDDARILEIWEVRKTLLVRLEALGMTEDAFLHPATEVEQNAVDGLVLCVYRLVEELGCVGVETQERHPSMNWRAVKGFRNILAHAYGSVDPHQVWLIIQNELDGIAVFCKKYAHEQGLELED